MGLWGNEPHGCGDLAPMEGFTASPTNPYRPAQPGDPAEPTLWLWLWLWLYAFQQK